MVAENEVMAEVTRRVWEKEPGSGASSDEIVQTGEDLLRGVIQEEVQRSRNPQAVALSQKELGGDPQSPPNSFTQLLIKYLCRTGDDLDQNNELQSLMKIMEFKSPKEVFSKVAKGMFADGKFSWDRITAFFYFAGKQAVKALHQNIPQVVKNIMGCAMEFLRSRLLGWITARGGWESLLAYFGVNTRKNVADAAGKALTGAFTGAFTGDFTGAFAGAFANLIGAAAGAVTGAIIGAIGGPIGALMGAAIGAFTTKKSSS